MAIILDGTNGISDVRSTTDGSAATPAIRGTDTNTGIFFPAADTIAFAEGGAEIARFDSSGNLGIGTATINNVVTTYRGAGVNNYIQFTNSTTGTASTDGCLIGVSADDTALRLRVLEAAPMIFTTSDTERMRIDSSGNVGIGTSSPTTVGGVALCVYDSSAPRIRLTNSTTGNTSTVGGELTIAGSDFIMENRTTSANIRWYNNGSERMRMDSSGNLLVNTTSATGSSKFVVAADTTSVNPMTVNNTRSTAATDYSILFYRNASLVGSVQTTLSATSYVTSSDYRLKDNIAPMTGALAKVTQLKPVTYKWKVDGSDGQGFIAHELQTVVPDCVTGTKDAVDADGNPVYQGIDTSFLVATLTSAIQEQQVIINELKSRIETLESK